MILWLVEWDTVYSKSDNYEKKVETMMINNSTNINKTNNHISPQIMEQKKEHDIWSLNPDPGLS